MRNDKRAVQGLYDRRVGGEESMGTSGPCSGVQESTAGRSEVGGGELAGRVRGANQKFPFGDVVQHKLALRCIS